MDRFIEINGRLIGPGEPVYIIAEMSANHNGSYDQAVAIIEAAKQAGADAVKLQTYTPDTMTIDKRDGLFRINGTPWDGHSLYELYAEAHTPWHWQPQLKKIAEGMGLDLFSTPFDKTAVDFLESLDVPAYKIASFENVDIPLLRNIAKTNKPVIMSTGMTSFNELGEGVRTLKNTGCHQLALLKCTSAYPTPIEEMHLKTIPHMMKSFNVPVGLSDHTLGSIAPVTAVALGACIVEKHFTLSRKVDGPDNAFSSEPDEFKKMVDDVRLVEKALGDVTYGSSPHESGSLVFRRSLFVVKDLKTGETFTEENVRSIRPGYGLHTRHLEEVMGRCATKDIHRGTPLSWDLVSEVAP
jgi:N-acetylneuraminate synthase